MAIEVWGSRRGCLPELINVIHVYKPLTHSVEHGCSTGCGQRIEGSADELSRGMLEFGE